MTGTQQSSRRSFLGLMALLPFAAPAIAKEAAATSAKLRVREVGAAVWRASAITAKPLISTLRIDAAAFSADIEECVKASFAHSNAMAAEVESRIKNLLLASASPQADASAAVSASMSPKVGADAAAPHSNPTLTGVASAPAELASAGSALSSDCIGDIDPDLEAAITALEVSWLRAGILMNAATLATIAASESFANSTSSVGA
jgi:hypothetical protein